MEKTITTSYVDPDLDGVACAIAYAEFLNTVGKPAAACIMGHPTAEAEFALDKLNVYRPTNCTAFEPHEIVVILDASEPVHFEGRLLPEQVIEVIDHRKMNEAEKFTNAKVQIELVGAAATLVAEKFRNQNVQPSTESAQILQAAIISNTQNFQAKTTTDRDFVIMKWLSEIATLPDNFTHDMFAAKSNFTGEKLERAMDIETATFEIAGKRLGVVQLEMVGSETLIHDRQEEILQILDRLKTRNNLDHIFLSMLDIDAKLNRFVTSDALMHRILAEALNVSFSGKVAVRDGIIMRKEIMPLIKPAMEKAA
jgi:manganese-dependent inorganic pyrophosphatase